VAYVLYVIYVYSGQRLHLRGSTMKQNITLSIDKELIKFAKVVAAQSQTSISGMLTTELEKKLKDTEKYGWAKRKAMDNLRIGLHLGGKRTVSRDELHER